MQNNTKTYIKELLTDLEIQTNTIKFELDESQKTRSVLSKIWEKRSNIL